MTSGSSSAVSPGKGSTLRHVPQRTCVSCRQSTAKRRLIRVVRLVDGSVVVDTTGKRSGRGAYLCWDRRCWQSALRKKALDRALKTTLTAEDKTTLEAYSRDIPEGMVEEISPPDREVS